MEVWANPEVLVSWEQARRAPVRRFSHLHLVIYKIDAKTGHALDPRSLNRPSTLAGQ